MGLVPLAVGCSLCLAASCGLLAALGSRTAQRRWRGRRAALGRVSMALSVVTFGLGVSWIVADESSGSAAWLVPTMLLLAAASYYLGVAAPDGAARQRSQ